MPQHPDSDFVAHLLELLKLFGEVTAKRMFGGHGIFRDGLMFGLVADGVLFLKVDDVNRTEFDALDLPPFRFTGKNGKTGTMSYHQCPDDALESAMVMNRWAESAFAAAIRNSTSKKKEAIIASEKIQMKKTTVTLLLAASIGICFAQETGKKGPERWEKDIAKFEAADAKNPPPKNAILFVGSSSIRMWKEGESFPDCKTINRGFGGSTLADSIHYFDRIIAKHEPKAILVYAGDNDVAKGLDADGVFADYQKLVALIEEKLPGTPLIFIAIKPSIKRWDMWPVMKGANDQIAAYCQKHDGYYFADIGKPMLETADGKLDPSLFKADGLHLTDQGYIAWTAVINPILKKAVAASGGK